MTETLTWPEAYALAGAKRPLLEAIAEFVRENYQVEGEFKLYKKAGDWVIFFRKSGKSLAIIDLKPSGFAVTVVIGSTLNKEMEAAGVSAKVMGLFETAHQYHDGRWLNWVVESEADVEDVKKLLLIKKKPGKKRAE